jgi:DNA-binding transcriptional regulator YiaG
MTGIPLLGDDYLTQQDLARELHVSVRTLARWHVERIGPPRIVVGRLLLYRRATIRDWLESREEQPRRKARR